MAIIVKSPDEVEKIRRACRVVGKVLSEIGEYIRPGVSTAELDRIAEKIIRGEGAVPSFKGYDGFPAAICASPDEVVIHGIPSSRQVLHEGQIISIDVGAILNGYHGDGARTYPVGEIGEDAARMIQAAKEAFYAGVSCVKAGAHLHEISAGVEKKAIEYGCGIVREFAGHGVGVELHEDPLIPNYKPIGRGPKLKSGMTLAIEPMLTLGNAAVRVLDDGWTTVTRDGSIASHYENTILVTEEGYEILTTV